MSLSCVDFVWTRWHCENVPLALHAIEAFVAIEADKRLDEYLHLLVSQALSVFLLAVSQKSRLYQRPLERPPLYSS